MKEIVAFFADEPELLTPILVLAEITLIAGLALAICRIWRNDAAARYGVAFTALVLIWLAVPMTLVLRAGGYSTVQVSRTLYTTPPPTLSAAELSEIAKLPLPVDEAAPAVYQVPWWVYLWVAGTAAILIRFAVGFWKVRRLRRQAAPLPHLKGAAPVFLTEEVAGPVVIGALRPSVLIPSSILDGLSESELRDVLAHEFAHVAHRHLLVAILQRLTVALFWPHPFVHLLSRHLIEAREEICDNVVLRSAGRARYARVLLRVAECRQTSGHFSASLGLFGPDSNLEERVKSLLDPHRRISTEMNYPRIALVALMLVSGAAALAGARVQTELVAAPIFDGSQLPPTAPPAKTKQAKETKKSRDEAKAKAKAELDHAKLQHRIHKDEIEIAKRHLDQAKRHIEIEIATMKAKQAKEMSEGDRRVTEKRRAEIEMRVREIAQERSHIDEHVKKLIEKEMRESQGRHEIAAVREMSAKDVEKMLQERAMLQKKLAERGSPEAVKALLERTHAKELAIEKSQLDHARVSEIHEKVLRELTQKAGQSDEKRTRLFEEVATSRLRGQDSTAALKAKIAAQEKEIARLNEMLRKLKESKQRGGRDDEPAIFREVPARAGSQVAPLLGRLSRTNEQVTLNRRTDSPLSRALGTLGTTRNSNLQSRTLLGRLTMNRDTASLSRLLNTRTSGSLRLKSRSLFESVSKKKVDKPKKQKFEDPFFVGDRITL